MNGTSSAKVKPGEAVSARTVTEPTPEAGLTRVQADFFDVTVRTWVFRKAWDVKPGSTIPLSSRRRWSVARARDLRRLAQLRVRAAPTTGRSPSPRWQRPRCDRRCMSRSVGEPVAARPPGDCSCRAARPEPRPQGASSMRTSYSGSEPRARRSAGLSAATSRTRRRTSGGSWTVHCATTPPALKRSDRRCARAPLADPRPGSSSTRSPASTSGAPTRGRAGST